jgi:hypothetical protein
MSGTATDAGHFKYRLGSNVCRKYSKNPALLSFDDGADPPK